MVVTRATFSSQDVCHYAQACKAVASSFGGGIDFRLRRLLDTCLLLLWVHGRLVLDKLLLDFVGMQHSSSLLVCSIDLVLIRIGLRFQEVVEGDALALDGLDFVPQTKDFLVWAQVLAVDTFWQMYGLGRFTLLAPRCDDGNEASQYGPRGYRQPHVGW